MSDDLVKRLRDWEDMDEDEWNKVTFDQAQEALAATEQKE